jgi:F420-dependent oxidoreductase-like protein
MKIGVQINRFDFESGPAKIGHEVAAIAKAADDAGFDSIWVMDHFFQIHMLGPATDPMLEAYTALGYIAGVTKHATLGTMVTGVIYREPAVLIKAVTTLDVLSGGRAYFGIGAGWNEDEAVGLGLPRPLAGGRFEKLEETLQIAIQMWSGETKPYKGKHYQLEHPICSPLPVSKPHPKILIGGGGEQKTLRLVAQYADACNLFAQGEIEHKLEVLRGHCQDLGRNFDDIEKTALIGMDVATAATQLDYVVARASELGRLGVSHIMFSNGPRPTLEAYKKIATRIRADVA